MPSRIEDYALIGDLQTGALVGRDGSIDWLCLPRFDSPACFAALLGEARHGRWQLAPSAPGSRCERRYREGTLILETDFECAEGAVRVIDFMPPRSDEIDLCRVVVGRAGRVRMRMELIMRLDYGAVVPWVESTETGIRAVAGPDALLLHTAVPLRGRNLTTVSEFTIDEGQRLTFLLVWHPSHESSPAPTDVEAALVATEEFWRAWSGRCTYTGPWRAAVTRSLITLKALTYAPTGGIVAALTTSLPEQLGGERNWDYRYCWLRDATFTLYALMIGGYNDEACAWREWLLRAVAGDPSEAKIMYGVAGERRLHEFEIDHLPGYEGAAPVRVGNQAHEQFQLDVFGEVIDTLYVMRRHGMPASEQSWHVQCALTEFVESAWRKADEGIWEVRGERRHFTHSKVMAWVAVDRMVKSAEHFAQTGPVEHWRVLRDTIHADICANGYSAELGGFTQYYGGKETDASLLMMPLVGFLPGSDPRVRGTVAAVERDLLVHGLVHRYRTRPDVDGLPPGEAAFLPCSFWLADNLILLDRRAEAEELFERLLSLRNDVGLLSEEYDSAARRLVGNFPQAFSHVALVNTAFNLVHPVGPASERAEQPPATPPSA